MLGAVHVLGLAREQQPVSVGTHSHVKAILECREILIELSEEPDVIGKVT
jgi:hypothetical protein